MSKLHEELLQGLKWVLFAIMGVVIIVLLWVGAAWSLGWFTEKFYDLPNFGSANYISFGSSILVFILLAQIITIILTAWGLLSWGKARGIYGKKESINIKK